ncbi:hypothetical protein ACVWYH_007314 [Bradyrhizobium sp. GM24.11]
MIINVSFDASVSSAPAAFTTAVNEVVQYFEDQFTDPITFTVAVGYGEVNGTALDQGALGQSITWGSTYSYADIRNAVVADAKTADDGIAANSLAAADPISGSHSYWMANAEAEALGLAPHNNSFDGAMGFATSGVLDFDASNGISHGTYDFSGVVMHELSEIMGRQAGLSPADGYELMDLFRYSAPGTHNFVGTHTAYLSLDGGQTGLASVNTDPGGDFGDWAASAGNDAALAFGNPQVALGFTDADLRLMDALGWDRSSSAPLVSNTVFDTPNNQPWQYEELDYDTQNRLDHLTVKNDDGTTTLTDFNPSQTENFKFAITTYNSSDQMTFVSLYPANDPNHSLLVTSYDPQHVQSWHDAISGYNAAGALAYVTVEKYDGTSSYTKYDHTPGSGIDDTIFNYDASGHLTSTVTQYHDGHTILV